MPVIHSLLRGIVTPGNHSIGNSKLGTDWWQNKFASEFYLFLEKLSKELTQWFIILMWVFYPSWAWENSRPKLVMARLSGLFFCVPFTSLHIHTSLAFFISFFILFLSCYSHVWVFGKTLFHEFHNSYRLVFWYSCMNGTCFFHEVK